MIYKRPNIKNISTTLLLSLLWGTTLSSAAEQQLITQDNALGTQHANLPAQGTRRTAANWGEFFAAYQPNMVVTHDTKNRKVFLYQGASLQAEMQSGFDNEIKALYLQPDHSVYVHVYADRNKIRYVQANGIILENIQSGLSFICDLYPQPDGSIILWGMGDAPVFKLVHVRPGVTSWKEINTGLSRILTVYPQPDGSILVKGGDAAGAAKLVHGRHSETNWKEIETGLTFIDKIYSQPDGSILVEGKDEGRAEKLIHGQPDGKSWQEIKTGLGYIRKAYPQYDGSIIVEGEDAAGAAKLIHSRPGEIKYKEINTGLMVIYDIYPQLDGSIIITGEDAKAGPTVKYISPDGQAQLLLGQRVLKVHEFLNAKPYINDTLSNLITGKDELDIPSLQHLCEQLGKFRQKPKDALFLFTKLHEKLHTHFHGPLQSDDLALPLSNKIGEDAYRAQQNLLTDTIADLRQKYESTWLSPYLDALYLEYSGIRDLVYTAKEGFKPLTLDGIKAESAGLSEEDPMHYKNRWDATLLADDILKNISDHAKELMQESDFKELYQHIRLAVEQLEQKPTASAPATPDASLSHTG